MLRIMCGLFPPWFILFFTVSAFAADPIVPINPFKGFVRAPFSVEAEVFAGGLTGKSIGHAFDSDSSASYGGRISFGILKSLNLSLNYMYSPQTRSLTAFLPPLSESSGGVAGIRPLVTAGQLPTGTALVQAKNVNFAWGDGEIALAHFRRSLVYISPGVGFARNASRSTTLVTPIGAFASSIHPGTAVVFNLGTGVKIFPRKHWGVRLDVRDFVSGGGTGDMNLQSQPCAAIVPPPPGCSSFFSNTQSYFGAMPIQNNLVFTLGLIYKLI